MKLSTLTFSILLLFALQTFAQGDKKSVELGFATYMQTLKDRDFKKAMDFMPEEFFEFVEKEQLIEVMESMFNNPDMEIKLENAAILDVKDINKIGEKYYSIIKYSSLMGMRFKSTKENQTAEELKNQNNLIKFSLQNTFGVDNVTFDEKTNWFAIIAKKSACAISIDGKTNWKFIVMESNQRFIIDKILPKQITDQL